MGGFENGFCGRVKCLAYESWAKSQSGGGHKKKKKKHA